MRGFSAGLAALVVPPNIDTGSVETALRGIQVENGCCFERYLGEEFKGSIFMDSLKGVAEGVIVETMRVHRDAKEKFGILFFGENLDFVERIPAGKRVSNHPYNQSSSVQVRIAWDAVVDEVDQSDTVTHPCDDRDVVGPDHGGWCHQLNFVANTGDYSSGEMSHKTSGNYKPLDSRTPPDTIAIWS